MIVWRPHGDSNPGTEGKRIRTADPLHAMQVLYQLSYTPEEKTHCIEHFLKNQDPYDFFLECPHVSNNDRVNQVNQEGTN